MLALHCPLHGKQGHWATFGDCNAFLRSLATAVVLKYPPCFCTQGTACSRHVSCRKHGRQVSKHHYLQAGPNQLIATTWASLREGEGGLLRHLCRSCKVLSLCLHSRRTVQACVPVHGKIVVSFQSTKRRRHYLTQEETNLARRDRPYNV